jgi:hypothetical protein
MIHTLPRQSDGTGILNLTYFQSKHAYQYKWTKLNYLWKNITWYNEVPTAKWNCDPGKLLWLLRQLRLLVKGSCHKTLCNKAKWNCDPGKLLRLLKQLRLLGKDSCTKHYVTRRNGIVIQVSCCGRWNSCGYWWRTPATKHYVTRRNGIVIQVSCCGCWDSRGNWWRTPAQNIM